MLRQIRGSLLWVPFEHNLVYTLYAHVRIIKAMTSRSHPGADVSASYFPVFTLKF